MRNFYLDYFFIFCLLANFLFLQYSAASILNGTVYFNLDVGKYSIKLNVYDPESGVAFGYLIDEINENGWRQLKIETSPKFDDYIQIHAAGYLEGALTQPLIFRYFTDNILNALFGYLDIPNSTFSSYAHTKFDNDVLQILEFLTEFFLKQKEWIEGQISSNFNDPYWAHISFILEQFNGMVEGYNSQAYFWEQLGAIEFWLLNSITDIPDLVNAAAYQNLAREINDSSLSSMNLKMPIMKPELRNKILQKFLDIKDLSFNYLPTFKTKYFQMDAQETFRYSHLTSLHCSGLVKWTSKKDELFFSHNTWTFYSSMIRIFKHYYFPLQHEAVQNEHILFSSYPGCLDSVDDFYLLDSKLAIFETTNEIFNLTNYVYVHPQSLFPWMRVILVRNLLFYFFFFFCIKRYNKANRLTSNGKDWATTFSKYNSGTYNNQWVIADYKLFQPNLTQLIDNTVW